MIYARRRHERQSRAKRRDITRARSAGIAAAYGPTAMAPYATAFGIRPYGQKHCMPPAKSLYAIGKIIVCHRQNHCMLLAKSLYATGGNIVCRGQRHQTANHGRSECRDVCLHHARCTVQPERQRITAIHPLRANETLACVSIFCRCHWLSCPPRAERAARMLRISPSYLARLTAEPRKRRR